MLMIHIAKKIHVLIHNAYGVFEVFQLRLHDKAVSSKNVQSHLPNFMLAVQFVKIFSPQA
jgi:hypothetical protein